MASDFAFAVSSRALALAVAGLGSACAQDLGECDRTAANEIVFSKGWQVATKGQALMSDSCGHGSFCHSAGATGSAREGAPAGMNFDMLPSAHGWPKVMDLRHDIWRTVDDGTMPPGGKAHDKVTNSDWTFDPLRRKHSARLPSLASEEGKGALRNWLACDAPVVADTNVPTWARGDSTSDTSDWSGLYLIVDNSCAMAGCHVPGSAAASGNLDLSDECGAYNALFQPSSCSSEGGAPRLTKNDPNSFFLNKISAENPRCMSKMPTTGLLPASTIQLFEDWVAAGAPSAKCGS